MPTPIALCLEDLDAEPRYLRCVALAGRLPGLVLDELGEVRWQEDGPAACELWVSADEQLILFRPEESRVAVQLFRGGRSLLVPRGKPVVVLDQDRIELSGRRLQLHIHGEAPAVHAPAPLQPEPQERRGASLVRAAATVLAIGAAVGGGACKDKPIEVRSNPPAVSPARPPDLGRPDTKPIEVRVKPPAAHVAPSEKAGTKPVAPKKGNITDKR